MLTHYLSQLHTDLEHAILHRWRACPPHYYQMGVPERWLDPPEGYTGPPFGFGQEEDEAMRNTYLAQLQLEKTFAEVEQYVEGRHSGTMFGHFGFDPEQFPPAERLTDEQMQALAERLCRLWAAFNYTAVFPEKTPGRVLYPLLIRRMGEPAMLAERGHIGIEFCDYEPEECPFGAEWCDCKDF